MGHIKEPKGVDFEIKSPPLTEQEKQEISKFIKGRKSKRQVKRKTPKIEETV